MSEESTGAMEEENCNYYFDPVQWVILIVGSGVTESEVVHRQTTAYLVFCVKMTYNNHIGVWTYVFCSEEEFFWPQRICVY